MKKFLVSFISLLCVGNIYSQQKWDFTAISQEDTLALQTAKSEWAYTASNKRYQNLVPISGPLTSGGKELNMSKGLTFVAAENKIRIDVEKRLQFAGKNISVTIPDLKKGQSVTIVFASTGDNAVTFDDLTNLGQAQGFVAADKTVTQTGTAIVTTDGAVSLKSTGGSINIFSISVSQGLTPPNGVQDDVTNTVPRNVNVNQAKFTLATGDVNYYNTGSVSSIDFDSFAGKVIVNVDGTKDIYNGSVASIDFCKKQDNGQNPVIDNQGVKITEAQGWLESAYVKFDLLENAITYNVYVKGGKYAEFTQIDKQLVRNYGKYGRADMVGLMSGLYAMKVVPVDSNKTEMVNKASTASNILVKNYPRQGFAFLEGYEPGAYKSDGTLKDGAKVFYVTKNTAKTISTNVVGAESNPCVGLQAIVAGYEKGQDKTPIAFRFIGLVTKDDLDAIGSKEEGIQVKGRRADSELNITFEGIGDDATIKGFGFLVRNSKSVEFRNLGIMRCLDDGLSLDTDNSNIWIHNTDVFYGPNGGGDHAKGDGATDVKGNSKYVTISYNRYWDTGKTNMFGMKSESGPNYISYDHNWFDHSDSRHPRVRTMSVHVWNNFFDNVAKYGVGATSGASVFVENNYFLKTKKPILSSLQGTDAQGGGTFSGEDGGMIKAYGNYFDRTAKNFKYYTQNNAASTGYDVYETSARDEQVPATEITKVGGTSYDNFDTNASLMYAYTPDDAADVPIVVTGYYGAGRLNHGDFTYSFSDNIGSDDADSSYDAVLGSLLDNYKSNLVGIFGDKSMQDGEGGEEQPGGNEEQPDGIIVATFDASPSLSMFVVGGSYGDGKITYNGTSLKKGVKLDSKGSITFTPQKDYNMVVVLATVKPGRDVKINGEMTTVSGTENVSGQYYEMESIPVVKGKEYVLTKGSGESIVMVIKLIPIEP